MKAIVAAFGHGGRGFADIRIGAIEQMIDGPADRAKLAGRIITSDSGFQIALGGAFTNGRDGLPLVAPIGRVGREVFPVGRAVALIVFGDKGIHRSGYGGGQVGAFRQAEHKLGIAKVLALQQINHGFIGSVHAGIGIGSALFDLEQMGIQRRYLGESVGIGYAAIGMVTNALAVEIVAGRDVGKNPVVAAIFGKVQNIGKYFIAALDDFPQQFEDTAGHSGMPDEVVRGAEEFRLGVAGDALKNVVGVRNNAALIGFADDDFVLGKVSFASSWRLIFPAHIKDLL